MVTRRRGSVVTVGINRPEVRNAVNQETAKRLLEALEAFDSDPDVTVAVLHGEGKSLTCGGKFAFRFIPTYWSLSLF